MRFWHNQEAIMVRDCAMWRCQGVKRPGNLRLCHRLYHAAAAKRRVGRILRRPARRTATFYSSVPDSGKGARSEPGSYATGSACVWPRLRTSRELLELDDGYHHGCWHIRLQSDCRLTHQRQVDHFGRCSGVGPSDSRPRRAARLVFACVFRRIARWQAHQAACDSTH